MYNCDNCETMSAAAACSSMAHRSETDMNCGKCQSLIENFLRGELTISERDDFVKHVRNCSVCMEELEVYHIVNCVVSQLDSETEDENIDYHATLNRMMTRSEGSYKRRRFLKIFTMIIAFILGAVTCLLLKGV